MAFCEIEPFGGTVDDLRAGIGPATAINVARAPPKEGEERPPPVSALAFFPWHNPKPEDETKSPADVAAAIVATLTAIGKANADGN